MAILVYRNIIVQAAVDMVGHPEKSQRTECYGEPMFEVFFIRWISCPFRGFEALKRMEERFVMICVMFLFAQFGRKEMLNLPYWDVCGSYSSKWIITPLSRLYIVNPVNRLYTNLLTSY